MSKIDLQVGLWMSNRELYDGGCQYKKRSEDHSSVQQSEQLKKVQLLQNRNVLQCPLPAKPVESAQAELY